MVPEVALPCGPFQKVWSVVSTRVRASARVTQPWSTPMQIADSPNPVEAMLHTEPGWLRSRIRPLAAFASSQKQRNAPYWRRSRIAAVVSAPALRASGGPAASVRRMASSARVFISNLPLPRGRVARRSEAECQREPIDRIEPSEVGPCVVETHVEARQALPEAEARGQPF